MQIIKNKEKNKEISHEMNEIFSNLNEGILMVQNKSINFKNEVFNDILKSINIDPNQTDLMDT